MNGTTHHIVAATTVITAAIISKDSNMLLGLPVVPLALIPLGVAGGFKADLDMGNNPEGRALKPILWVVKKLPFMKQMLAHRGATHTLIIPVLSYLLASVLANASQDKISLIVATAILGWGIGYTSHLLADLFNGKGIPILAPVVNKRIHIASFSTGTAEEYVFLFLWVIFTVGNAYLIYTGNILS